MSFDARPRFKQLVVLAFLSVAGCSGGSGSGPITLDADRYEAPKIAAGDETSAPAAPQMSRGDIHNPKDDLFPPD